MSDCKYSKLIVGQYYLMRARSLSCMNCSAQQPAENKVKYLGHDLEAGQMCDAFSIVVPLHCECGETIRICFDPCGGDGWTSDLFTRQRESVEVHTPADTEATTEEATR